MDVEPSLTSETIEQLAAEPPRCVAAEVALRDALLEMKQHNVGHLLVCRDQVLVGIFTERDALRFMAENGSLDDPVSRYMTSPAVTVSVGVSVASAINSMVHGGYRRLPIVEPSGRPVGVVKVSAIVHWLVQHFPKAVYNLPQSSHAMLEREGP